MPGVRRRRSSRSGDVSRVSGTHRFDPTHSAENGTTNQTSEYVWVPRTVSPPLISESLPADLAVPAGAGRARSPTYGPGRQ
jgi:hypothetical protein